MLNEIQSMERLIMSYGQFYKHLSRRAAQVLDAENPLISNKKFNAALLLGGTALGIYLGTGNSGGSTVPTASMSPARYPALKQIENEAAPFQQYKYLAQNYSEGAFCRAEAQTLARKHFSSNDRLKYNLAAHLAETYKIAPKHADEIVRTAAKVSKEQNVDPFLMLGIIAKESSFRQTAKSGYGATGLMQVHAPSHKALLKTMGLNVKDLKLTEKSLQSGVRLNVTAGVQIYKQYEQRYESREKALQAYNGAKNDATMKYAKSVLAFRDAFSARAAFPIECGEAGYAFVKTNRQKLALMHQKRKPA
jgi:soluble lytic murein transglycosylase-like protein